MSPFYNHDRNSLTQTSKFISAPKTFRKLFKDRSTKQTIKQKAQQKINQHNLSSLNQNDKQQCKIKNLNQSNHKKITLQKQKLHSKRLTEFKEQKRKYRIGQQNNDKLSIKSLSSIRSAVILNVTENNNSNNSNDNNDKLKSYVRKMKLNQTLNNNKFNNGLNIQKNKKQNINSFSRHTNSQCFQTKSSQSISRISNKKFKQGKDQDTKSVTSLSQSRQISRSNVLLGKFLATQMSEDQNDKTNTFKENRIGKLKTLQQKLQKITSNKLNSFILHPNSNHRLTSKPFFGSGSTSLILQRKQLRSPTKVIYPYNENNSIDQQILSMITHISNLKQNQNTAQNIRNSTDQQIIQVNKKIQILEKILASSNIESQILKNYYFAIKSQKYPYLTKRQKLLNEIAKRNSSFGQNHILKSPTTKSFQRPIVKLQTTTSYFYKKPQRSAYKLDKHSKNNSFCINRQPLPRSMYGREFLNYGTIPTFSCKPEDQSLNVSSKLANITTNYQQAFKQKNQDLKQIDYRQLDCFRNKIRAPKISFNEILNKKNADLKKKKIIRNNVTDDNLEKSSLKSLLKSKNDKKVSNYLFKQSKSLPKFKGQSQMKRQFTNWGNTKTCENQHNQQQTTIKSMPKNLLMSLSKNGNLNKLKAAYKLNYVR